MLGRRVGNYQIVSVLGRGGVSVVYRATHVHLPRTDAVKILGADAASDAEQISRFIDEARALGRLRHPGVVEIFDCGPLDDGAYLAMALLEGETVEARVGREGPLPLAFVVDVATQLAAALDAVHAQGIVHRDVKPANVFLVRDDEQPFGARVKLLDFGIAKHQRPSGGRRTAPGALMGTPQYMSPEQCSGIAVDRRADVYTLGVLIYEMATGQPPFLYDDITEALRAHLSEPPPPLEKLRPDAPPHLREAVRRALAKDRRARFATAGELANAIALPVSEVDRRASTQPMSPVANPGPSVAEPLPRSTLDDTPLVPPRNRTPAVALATGLVVVLGLAALIGLRPTGAKKLAAPPPPPPIPMAATVEPAPPPPPPLPPPRETYFPADTPPPPPRHDPRPSKRPHPAPAASAPSPAPDWLRTKSDLHNPFGE